ncbi:double-stranded RNA-specific editase B2-like isoform X2 [Anopheles bellator]|uniref:double-stranded RNA-specific editase B2-like isoform X2 n=1 Tax=Anopheles bellator TaxID=139047 RepID=UPI0026494A16|nr:double-stranded RNA-specific editase B2-like isoform X2 [Anopheles bellator]
MELNVYPAQQLAPGKSSSEQQQNDQKRDFGTSQQELQQATGIINNDDGIDSMQMVESNSAESNDSSLECNADGIGAKFKKYFVTKKPLTAADRKKGEKERKARQLRRLRKWLMPKNAVVALHELQGPGMSEFIINTNGQETTAEIIINNVRYEATAANKTLAKAKASEKALRDLAISQMNKVKQQQGGNVQGNDSNMDVETTDSLESDGMPMMHLASFALYKLFTEWQNEGFEIPVLRSKPKVAATTADTWHNPLAPKHPKTRADLPTDAATRHPTALLAYMRPQVPYEDLGTENDMQDRIFVAGITVDGLHFVGKGRSKKLARKAAAIDACKKLFEIKFEGCGLE